MPRRAAELPEVLMLRLPPGTAELLAVIAVGEGARAGAIARRFVLEGLRRHPLTQSQMRARLHGRPT